MKQQLFLFIIYLLLSFNIFCFFALNTFSSLLLKIILLSFELIKQIKNKFFFNNFVLICVLVYLFTKDKKVVSN